MFILLRFRCLPSIRDDYPVFDGLWFLLFAAYTSMTPVQPFLGFKIYLVMRLGLTAVYYLAPSIVGVVIVVVLSSMWKTEARCFFMVTAPFYF